MFYYINKINIKIIILFSLFSILISLFELYKASPEYLTKITLSEKEKIKSNYYNEISNLLKFEINDYAKRFDDASFYNYYLESPSFLKLVFNYKFEYEKENKTILDFLKLKLNDNNRNFPFFLNSHNLDKPIQLSADEEDLIKVFKSKIELINYDYNNYFEIKSYHEERAVSKNLLVAIYNSLQKFILLNKNNNILNQTDYLKKNINRLEKKRDSLFLLKANFNENNQNYSSLKLANIASNFQKEIDLVNEEYNLLKKQYSLLKNIDLNEKNLFDIVSPMYTYDKRYYPSISRTLFNNFSICLMISILLSFIFSDFKKLKLFSKSTKNE